MSMTDLDEIVRRVLRLNTHSDSRSRWSVVHISAIKTWICEEGHNIWTYRRLRWSSAVKEVIDAFAGDLQIDVSERNKGEMTILTRENWNTRKEFQKSYEKLELINRFLCTALFVMRCLRFERSVLFCHSKFQNFPNFYQFSSLLFRNSFESWFRLIVWARRNASGNYYRR